MNKQTKKPLRKQPEWVKVRKLPLSTDLKYPYCIKRHGKWVRRWPRHWRPRLEHRVHNPDSATGFTYFAPTSVCHLCGDYDALMLAGNRVERRTREWRP